MLLWLTDLDHMFVFTFPSALQLINQPLIPENAEYFHTACPVPCEGRVPVIKFQTKTIPFMLARNKNSGLIGFFFFFSSLSHGSSFSHPEIILRWQVQRRWKITTIRVQSAPARPISILMEI